MQRLVYIQKLCCFATHPLQSVVETDTQWGLMCKHVIITHRNTKINVINGEASEKSDSSCFLSNLHPSILMCFHPLRLKSTI